MNDEQEKSTPASSQQMPSIESEKAGTSNKNDRKPVTSGLPGNASRRSFIKRAGGLAAVAAMVPLEPLLGEKETRAEASVITYAENTRATSPLLTVSRKRRLKKSVLRLRLIMAMQRYTQTTAAPGAKPWRMTTSKSSIKIPTTA